MAPLKTCFKCGERKPLSAFYSHPQMKDGRLNKCMECTKRDSAARIEKMKLDPKWVAKERERSRIKMAKARAAGKVKRTNPEVIKAWARRNKEKRRAQSAAYRSVKTPPDACEMCRAIGLRLERHHPDYSRPKYVVWLCSKCHGKTRWKDSL